MANLIYLDEPNTSHTTQALRSTFTTSNQFKSSVTNEMQSDSESISCRHSERQFALNTFILPTDQIPKAIGITAVICKAMFAAANAQQHLKSRTQAF